MWAADPRASGPPPATPFAVREVDTASAGALTAAMGTEGDLVARRLARGCRCFGVWLGEVLVGYGWLSTRPEWIGEIQLEITPRQGEAYIWNCVTLPSHRRKGVFRALVASIVAQAREEGLARLWIGSVDNLGGRSVVQAGFVPVLRFDTTTRLGLRWLTVSPMDGVERGLLAAGLEVMAVTTGSSVRRFRRRRH